VELEFCLVEQAGGGEVVGGSAGSMGSDAEDGDERSALDSRETSDRQVTELLDVQSPYFSEPPDTDL